jgi:hypothetical protein
MNLLKQGFGFYVFANIHVALASYCLIRITFLEFDFENQSLALFVFFATILSYNMIRLVQLDRINSMTAIWIRAHKKGLVLLNIMALFGLVYFAFDLNLSGFIALLPFVVATLFYVLPIKNKSSGLRQIPGFKLFLIAISWAGITLYFPIQEADFAVSNQWLFFVQRFLFVLAITIPFDIRDSQFDLRELATLPQVLGVNKAKIVAIIAVLAFLGIDLFLLDISSSMFKIHLLIVLISMVLIGFSSPIRNRFYTTFWVEAIPIVWYVLMLLFTNQGVF